MAVKPIPEGYHTVTPYQWWMATHIEDLSKEERERRAAEVWK